MEKNELKEIIKNNINNGVMTKEEVIGFVNSLPKKKNIKKTDPILEYVYDKKEGITHETCMDYALTFIDCMKHINDEGAVEWTWWKKDNQFMLRTDDREYYPQDEYSYMKKVNELFKKYDIKYEAIKIEVNDSYENATTSYIISLKKI